MRQPGWQTYSELTATYDRAIQFNTTLNDDKAGVQAKGLRSLLAGTICLAVIPATVLIVIVLGILPGR